MKMMTRKYSHQTLKMILMKRMTMRQYQRKRVILRRLNQKKRKMSQRERSWVKRIPPRRMLRIVLGQKQKTNLHLQKRAPQQKQRKVLQNPLKSLLVQLLRKAPRMLMDLVHSLNQRDPHQKNKRWKRKVQRTQVFLPRKRVLARSSQARHQQRFLLRIKVHYFVYSLLILTLKFWVCFLIIFIWKCPPFSLDYDLSCW